MPLPGETGRGDSLFLLVAHGNGAPKRTVCTGGHAVEQQSVFAENIEALTADYQRLWPLMPSLHSSIARLAGKETIKACARRLGMLSKQGGKLGVVFEHELEAEIFQDYLIYMHRPRGITLVRQMLNRKRYPRGSDEQSLLEGMVQARFSVFWVREVHPAGGFVALDVIRGEEYFILDQSLPQQDAVGTLSACRIFPFRGAWLHTGANMVFGTIDDPAGMQPLGRMLNEKEEQELNEENIRRWRALLKR